VFTKPNRPIPGTATGAFTRAAADAVEDAPWSARRDTSTGYGIAGFDVAPSDPGLIMDGRPGGWRICPVRFMIWVNAALAAGEAPRPRRGLRA